MRARIQGTPVKFRDGPAAVIDVTGNFLRQKLHYLSAIVEKTLCRVLRQKLLTRRQCDGHIGSQKTYHLPGAT